MTSVAEKENEGLHTADFRKNDNKIKKAPLKLNVCLSSSSGSQNRAKTGPFGVSRLKQIGSNVGRRALGDLKNIHFDINNQTNSKNLTEKESLKKSDIIQNLKQKDKFDEVEYCPNIEPDRDTFEDICPLTERVSSCFPPNCFDKLFVSTPNSKLSESDYDEIWNLQPLKDIPVKNLLKQADNMRTDVNYPICETAYELLKDICNALQD